MSVFFLDMHLYICACGENLQEEKATVLLICV